MSVNQELNLGVTILHGPQDWQILQQDPSGHASITLQGTWRTKEEHFFVQARIIDQNSNTPVTSYLDWQNVTMDLANQSFTITLAKIPAGGLYRVETRIRHPQAKDRRAFRGDCIHHLGVGDLYVIAGQSNASGTGKGYAVDGPMLGVHQLGNDEQWKLATHPIEDATNTLHPITITRIFHGTSPWLTFGKYLYQKTRIPIGLIPTALGGSSISKWVNNHKEPGVLFNNMEDMIIKAGGKIRGLVWYQGETDSKENRMVDYAEKFTCFVNLVRELVDDPDLPIITGQLNSVKETWDDAGWTQVREIQRQLANQLHNVSLVVTIDCPMSDEIHNNSIGNVMLGERFAINALDNIYHYPINSRHPEPTKASYLDSEARTVKVEFSNVTGDWTPYVSNNEFIVETESGFIKADKITLNPDTTVIIHLESSAPKGATLHGLYGCNPQVTLKDDNDRCLTPFSITIS